MDARGPTNHLKHISQLYNDRRFHEIEMYACAQEARVRRLCLV